MLGKLMTVEATHLQLRHRSGTTARVADAQGSGRYSRIRTNPTRYPVVAQVEGREGAASKRNGTPARVEAAPTLLNRQPSKRRTVCLILTSASPLPSMSGGDNA